MLRLLLYFLLILPLGAVGQMGLPMEKKAIAPGLTWWSVDADDLLGTPQNVEILAIDPEYRFDLAWMADTLIRTSDFAQDAGAIAAINGGFFDMKNGGSVTLLRADKQVVHQTAPRLIEQKNEILEGVLLIDRRGRIEIRSTQKLKRYQRGGKHPDLLVTGPLLLLDGVPQPLQNRAFNNDRHPRSCVCLTRDEQVLLITVDGRHEEAAGMSLEELTRFSRALNCQEAINLDGGGSTTLFLKDRGVINHPSDNQRFDALGERPCANALLVFPPK